MANSGRCSGLDDEEIAGARTDRPYNYAFVNARRKCQPWGAAKSDDTPVPRRTVASGQETSIALNQMLATSERLLDRMENDGDSYDRYLEAIPELGAVATKLDSVMASVDGILGKDVSFGSLIDGIFWRLVILIIVFFAALLLTGVLYKLAVQRFASEPSRD